MLKKVKRVPIRKGTAFERTDVLNKGVFLMQANELELRAIRKGIVLSENFDDDLLINMLIQREHIFVNKIHNYNYVNRRFVLFYPSFVPLQHLNVVVPKHKYFWYLNGQEIECINCGSKTRTFLNNFTTENLLCESCVDNIVSTNKDLINIDPKFSLVTYSIKHYIKNDQDVALKFTKNSKKVLEQTKKHHKDILEKIRTRLDNEFGDTLSEEKLNELKKIFRIAGNLF